jgi:hypothetical protein
MKTLLAPYLCSFALVPRKNNPLFRFTFEAYPPWLVGFIETLEEEEFFDFERWTEHVPRLLRRQLCTLGLARWLVKPTYRRHRKPVPRNIRAKIQGKRHDPTCTRLLRVTLEATGEELYELIELLRWQEGSKPFLTQWLPDALDNCLWRYQRRAPPEFLRYSRRFDAGRNAALLAGESLDEAVEWGVWYSQHDHMTFTEFANRLQEIRREKKSPKVTGEVTGVLIISVPSSVLSGFGQPESHADLLLLSNEQLQAIAADDTECTGPSYKCRHCCAKEILGHEHGFSIIPKGLLGPKPEDIN